MGLLFFACALYFACAVLIMAEVFIPSAGLLSICAAVCMITGIFLFFMHSTTAGLFGIVLAMALVPLSLVIGFKFLPQTRWGKKMMLTPADRQHDDATPDFGELAKLVGQTSTVVSSLRPVGICDFDGKRIECIAEYGYIDAGKNVRVLAVEGARLKVREL